MRWFAVLLLAAACGCGSVNDRFLHGMETILIDNKYIERHDAYVQADVDELKGILADPNVDDTKKAAALQSLDEKTIDLRDSVLLREVLDAARKNAEE